MKDASSLDKIEEPLISHVLALIHILVAYVLSDTIVWILSTNIPSLFTTLSFIFQELTLTIALVFFYLLFIRLQSKFLIFLNTVNSTSPLVGIVSLLILNHPLIISFEGTRIKVLWLIFDIVQLGNLGIWLLETLIIGFSGYLTILILDRSDGYDQSSYKKYVPYLAQDVLHGLLIVLIAFYLIRSFIIENFESIAITTPIKIILVYLFYLSIAPESKLKGKNDSTENS